MRSSSYSDLDLDSNSGLVPSITVRSELLSLLIVFHLEFVWPNLFVINSVKYKLRP